MSSISWDRVVREPRLNAEGQEYDAGVIREQRPGTSHGPLENSGRRKEASYSVYDIKVAVIKK